MKEFLDFIESNGLTSKFWRDMRNLSSDFSSPSKRNQYLFSDFQKYIIPHGHNPFEYYFKGIGGDWVRNWNETATDYSFHTALDAPCQVAA